jgi:hypothetical protein
MLGRLIVRVIALLLVLNGLGGLAAVWAGWGLLGVAVVDLREATGQLAPEQARMVARLRDVGAVVGDASEATDGFARSMERARTAVGEGGQAAGELAGSFDQLVPATEVEIVGRRPLEQFAEPFAASAASFRRLGSSLSGTADSLGDNARDTARVSADLKRARERIDDLASSAEAFRPQAYAERGLDSLDLGLRGLLGLLALQAALSMLTGLALLLLSGTPRAAPQPAMA